MRKFLDESSIFLVVYQPFKLELHPKVGILRPKSMRKKLPKLQKSPENDFFAPQNVPNTGIKLAKSVDFWVHFQSMSPNIALLVLKKKIKIVPPYS